MPHPSDHGPVILLLCLAALGAEPCSAQQQDNPVYVDDSPQAWMLFQQAHDQLTDNIGESARLYEELLTDFGQKLIPAHGQDESYFASIRQRVLDQLRSDPDLLERYRLIETAAAQRLVDQGQLTLAAQTRSLTEPGLEATLRLSQNQLEAGHFYASLHWLTEAIDHPDLTDRRAIHLWHMIGVASHFIGDDAMFEKAVERLASLPGSADFVDHLHQLDRKGIGPGVVRGLTSLDQSPLSDLSGLIAEEIWSMDLDQSLINQRYPVNPEDPTLGRDVREQRRHRGQLNTSAPTIAGEVVYINEGHTIQALDRFTGRPIWKRPFSDLRDEEPEDTNVDLTFDMNVVTVESDSLVTLTGYLLSRGRSNSGKVVCLDAQSGELRWIRDISHIDEADEFERLFPHGRPLIADGLVFVMARKARKQQLTACYVIALDLATGSLRWSRHISTSGGIRGTTRSYSSLTYDRGSLYVASPLGAVARLEAHDGEIRWLRRYAVPLNNNASASLHMPWEFDAPVLINDSVVAMRSDRRQVVVIDRESGEELESHNCTTSDGWGQPRYLLANRHSIYAIGRDVVAFRSNDLTQPAWRFSDLEQIGPDGEPSPGRRPDLRGRVQLMSGKLVIPSLSGILIVDDETGQIEQELKIPVSGNPVAYDSQILLAGSDRLDSYMSFDRAQEMLRERIVSSPTDPDPALSLLKLGLRVRRLDLALESANMVLAAMNRSNYDEHIATAHEELFNRLLEVDERGLAEDKTQGENLFALINSVADTAPRRIEYLLAYGRWLSRFAPQQAIEQSYQAILSDPDLASTWRQKDGANRTAADWAAQCQQELIEQHGPQIYAAQNDFARMRFDQLNLEEHPNPIEMTALIEEFPHAEVSTETVLTTADLLVNQGTPRAAMSLLASVYRGNPNSPRINRILGRYVSLCRLLGWNAEAKQVLIQVNRTHPDLILETGEGSSSAKALLESIAPESTTENRPAVSRPEGDAIFLDGRLVAPLPGTVTTAPFESFLLQKDDQLKLLNPGSIQPVWTTPVEDTPAQILDFDRDALILWYGFGDNAEDPRAVKLDAETGNIRWISSEISGNFDNPIRDLKRINPAQRPNQSEPSFDPRLTLPFYNGRILIQVQGTGRILALSAQDGQTVLWKEENAINQVHHALLEDSAFVIAGVLHRTDALGATINMSHHLEAFDPETGDRIWKIQPLGNAPVLWMKPMPFGMLAYGTTGGVEVVDAYTGLRLWSNTASGSRDSQEAWPLTDRILIHDRESRLRTLGLSDAVLSPPFDLSLDEEMNPLELREIVPEPKGLMARYRNRVIRFGFDGSLLGADAIMGTLDYKWLLPAENRYLLINAHSPRQLPDEGQAGRRIEYIYELYILAEDGKVLEPPYQFEPLRWRMQHASLKGQWLLISTRDQTYAIPMIVDG